MWYNKQNFSKQTKPVWLWFIKTILLLSLPLHLHVSFFQLLPAMTKVWGDL